jgi:FAD-linked sulfhydryl oxidase
MTLNEDFKEACRACIDVKSWFRENKPKMATSATISAALLYKDPHLEAPIEHKLSSKGIICPPDSRELGRATWTFLHTTVAYLPEELSFQQSKQASLLLEAVAALYPCRNCGEHMSAYLETNPLDASSRQSLSLWLCNFHNEVNEMLGKEKFDCDRVQERWQKGPNDDSCAP